MAVYQLSVTLTHIKRLMVLQKRKTDMLMTWGMLSLLILEDFQVNIIGPLSVIGRSLVLQQDEDDLDLTIHELSKTTGNTGARVACGVIVVAKKISRIRLILQLIIFGTSQ